MNHSVHSTITSIALAAISLIAASCGHKQPDAIVTVEDAVLTRNELHDAMPHGLTAADSARFAETYIRNWIDDQLIEKIAIRNIPDTREIDRLTREYRRQLILHEYRVKMAEAYAQNDFPDDTLRQWYDQYGSTLHTTSPYIKGIYMKLPAESPALADARRHIRSTRQKDIDRMEQAEATVATDYEYFRDQWVEWKHFEAKLPGDFTADSETWLKNNRKLDMTSGGFTYLIDITDYMPAGAKMPYEMAVPVIREKLMANSKQEYDRRLRSELYDKALADGKIVIY